MFGLRPRIGSTRDCQDQACGPMDVTSSAQIIY